MPAKRVKALKNRPVGRDRVMTTKDNNIRIALAIAAVCGIGLFIVGFYFLFRFLTYPGW